MQTSQLIATGFAFKFEGMEFDPQKPFRACMLCGAVYQSNLARELPSNPEVQILNQRWADYHSRKHPEREHNLLRASGRSMTPEAAQKLVAYGVIALSDMVMDEETAAALMESSPIPKVDSDT